MAKSNQTFRKRQRENKLREKAQLKRERREQRRNERKDSQALVPQPAVVQPRSTGLEPSSANTPETVDTAGAATAGEISGGNV